MNNLPTALILLIATLSCVRNSEESAKDYSNLTNLSSRNNMTSQGIEVMYDSYEVESLVIANFDCGKMNWYEAKEACADLVIEGARDWRLPTPKELELIYNRIDEIDHLKRGGYWSSEEPSDTTFAWYQEFTQDGKIHADWVGKKNLYNVRAVRGLKLN